MATNPVSGKPDLNTHPTSSDTDQFPGSLGERQARAFRPDPTVHRGTALAVMGSDGLALGSSTNDVLQDILLELRLMRMGQVFAGVCEDVVDGDNDDIPNV